MFNLPDRVLVYTPDGDAALAALRAADVHPVGSLVRRSSLEDAAAKSALQVQTSAPFNRRTFVPGLGFNNEAIGTAFGAPLGTPVLARTLEAVYVIRVNSRSTADREDFDMIKEILRQRDLPAAREARVRSFVDALRRNAKVVDSRREINAVLRRQVVE